MLPMKICSVITVLLTLFLVGCGSTVNSSTARQEQHATEQNQQNLLTKQPPPRIEWSLERDNLTKRFKLQNDRSITFFMYVFIEGISDPIGYYQVNKVSSTDSQLTNTVQAIDDPYGDYSAGSILLPSPAEDGSYGTNGNGVFGFTPEDIYIETNMKYIVATVPLTFTKPVNRLAVINTDEASKLLEASKNAMR